MSSLQNKRILLGVSGGIAAYKSAELVRRLQDEGASVRVVMTRAATEFITPLTMQALSGHPVSLDMMDTESEATMSHIELARWADLILVAPATANLMARLSHGEASDLLSALCLVTTAPLALAPAMNQGMWQKPATQENLTTLRDRGLIIFGPAEGYQACGDVGPGRMIEPADIVAAAAGLFESGKLSDKRIVITAGPTREAIDPVRYLSNQSSGKMGYALARAAVEFGAKTTLISGPVNLDPPDRVDLIKVISAREMYDAAVAAVADCDVFIAAAAVCDYRPVNVSAQKIKKSQGSDRLVLELTENPDIVTAVASLKEGPFTIGFAAETENLETHAREKLERKGLDWIIANNVAVSGIGFDSDENEVTLITSAGSERFPRTSKQNLARQIMLRLIENIQM